MKKTLAVLMMAAAVAVSSLTAFAEEADDQNDKYTQEHTPGQSVEVLLEEVDVEASDLKVTNKLTSGKDAVESEAERNLRYQSSEYCWRYSTETQKYQLRCENLFFRFYCTMEKSFY